MWEYEMLVSFTLISYGLLCLWDRSFISTKTCTKWPSAHAKSLDSLNKAISYITLVLPILKVDKPASTLSGYLSDFLEIHLVSGETAIVWEVSGL